MSKSGWLGGPSVLACLTLALSGCGIPWPVGATSSSPAATPPTPLTPLQVRDELNDLDIFADCYDPASRKEDLGYDATEVSCYILDQADRPNFSEAKRGITAWILPGSWAEFEQDFCLWRLNSNKENDDMRLVTDSRGFVIFGRLDTNFGDWPQEVWPEDVQRVLGGEVVTLGALCDRRYDK